MLCVFADLRLLACVLASVSPSSPIPAHVNLFEHLASCPDWPKNPGVLCSSVAVQWPGASFATKPDFCGETGFWRGLGTVPAAIVLPEHQMLSPTVVDTILVGAGLGFSREMSAASRPLSNILGCPSALSSTYPWHMAPLPL